MDAKTVAEYLQDGADDPMWADHCEMSKRTVAAAAELLRQQAAELAALREANARFGKRQEWWTERMFALEQERDALRAEREALTHNVRVLTDAVWKACGDNEECVNATISSQGELR